MQDVGASGPWPYISATPELHTIATDTMKKILWMDTDHTMYDVWSEYTQDSIGVLGSGSDYTSFVHEGIGSVGAFQLVATWTSALSTTVLLIMYRSMLVQAEARRIPSIITTAISIVIIG